MKYFIKQGVGLEFIQDLGNVPLVIVRYLVEERGLDVGDFFDAVRNDYLGVVQYLVEDQGADIKAKDKHGSTPLHLAGWYGRLGIVKYLLEQGADLEGKDNYGNTLLHAAARNGHLQIVDYLVNQGANLEVRDNSGNKPIHVALRNSRSEVVKYLVEQGANLETKDEKGNTPLQIARLSKDVELVEYLASKGASRKRRSVASKLDVILPEFQNDAVISGARQATSWINDFVGVFKRIPQRVFFPANTALAEREAVKSTRMPRDDVKFGCVGIEGTLLLCDFIIRKMSKKRHSTFFKESEWVNLESGNYIVEAIDKFPSRLEDMVVTKAFNNTF